MKNQHSLNFIIRNCRYETIHIHCTSKLGIKDEDGFYRITGRIKDMIIRGGENIYPREIEEFLYHMPGIKDVQVAAVPSKKYGEAVGAFIILNEGVKMEPEDVQEFCRGKIARYKIPKYVFFIDQFPLTGSGKIQKFKLKEMSLDLCKVIHCPTQMVLLQIAFEPLRDGRDRNRALVGALLDERVHTEPSSHQT